MLRGASDVGSLFTVRPEVLGKYSCLHAKIGKQIGFVQRQLLGTK
jgi:hypothetical protein